MNSKLKRFFYIISLCGLAVTLSACSEEDLDFSTLESTSPTFTTQPVVSEGNMKYDLSEAPLGMQQGVISIEYYQMLMELIDKISEYNVTGRQITDTVGLTLAEKKENQVELAQDILVYLNSFQYSPTNDVEREIHNYTIKVIVSLESLAEYRIKLYRGDDAYRQLALDAEQNSIADTEIWVKIMDKYNLFL